MLKDTDRKTLEELAGKYLGGETDRAEEMRLGELLRKEDPGRLTPEYRALRIMLGGFAGMAQERRPRRRASRHRRLAAAIYSAAAAAAVIAAVLSVDTVYGYDADGKPIKDKGKALAQAECLQMLSQLESSMETAGELAGLLEYGQGADKDRADKDR